MLRNTKSLSKEHKRTENLHNGLNGENVGETTSRSERKNLETRQRRERAMAGQQAGKRREHSYAPNTQREAFGD